MDIKQKQIAVDEQKIVIETLARLSAKQGCKFLEIGSWCGDSTLILGKVAKENQGHLYCIDWWKGNIGTDLVEIAETTDIYSFFWERICSEGLEDTVIPIRASSCTVWDIFKEETFDLIYIDADHRYNAVFNDIQRYMPLVRQNGILCGDDCEGFISDYNLDFLEHGKEIDYFETVHCGVVLAVGSTFQEYSINYNIWSVRKTGASWISTVIEIVGIEDKVQYSPPTIDTYSDFNILRYHKSVYAVPFSMGSIDITYEKERSSNLLINATDCHELKNKIDEIDREELVRLRNEVVEFQKSKFWYMRKAWLQLRSLIWCSK